MTKKIAILFTNYGPYHLSRLEAFHQHCQTRYWEVTGLELTRSGVDYQWKTTLEKIACPIISLTSEEEFFHLSWHQLVRKLYHRLSKLNPDIIAISGYARPAMLAALFWCQWHQKIAILFSETHERDAKRRFWREGIKSAIVSGYRAALVGGQPHKSYLEKLGFRSDRIFTGYDTVDNSVFDPQKNRSLPRPVQKNYFIAISRFIPKKNIAFLLDCYSQYRQKIKSDRAWDLVLCGDGELKAKIERQIRQLHLQEFVCTPGFLQQNELLPYFAHASCFIHSSTVEQWGLVVNEAMASGLPVLVSNRCGCFEDLVVEGVNGFGFDPENRQQLIDLMVRMSTQEIDLQKMGQAALEHIQNFSPDRFARGLIAAIEAAIKGEET